MGDLIQTFRRSLTRIAEIERNIASEQIELAGLRHEIDELRAALQVDATTDQQAAEAIAEAPPARHRRPIRASSSVGYAKRVLEAAGGPMYVDEIIVNIRHMTGLEVEKATLVSNLSRYVNAHDTFMRTAPNTFGLLDYKADESEMRLVG